MDAKNISNYKKNFKQLRIAWPEELNLHSTAENWQIGDAVQCGAEVAQSRLGEQHSVAYRISAVPSQLPACYPQQ